MEKYEGSVCVPNAEISPEIAEAVLSIKATLESVNKRMDKLETRLEAIYEEVKKPKPSEIRTSLGETRVFARAPQNEEATVMRKKAPHSPKTMMILMKEEEREEQQMALD